MGVEMTSKRCYGEGRAPATRVYHDTGWVPITCQWLKGEPHRRAFCGAPVREGSAYCATHHARAYTGVTAAKVVPLGRMTLATLAVALGMEPDRFTPRAGLTARRLVDGRTGR